MPASDALSVDSDIMDKNHAHAPKKCTCGAGRMAQQHVRSMVDRMLGSGKPADAAPGPLKKKRVAAPYVVERNKVVRQVMAQHPEFTLPQASKYVKEHNLFKRQQ